VKTAWSVNSSSYSNYCRFSVNKDLLRTNKEISSIKMIESKVQYFRRAAIPASDYLEKKLERYMAKKTNFHKSV
jgi:hypothetical protein